MPDPDTSGAYVEPYWPGYRTPGPTVLAARKALRAAIDSEKAARKMLHSGTSAEAGQ